MDISSEHKINVIKCINEFIKYRPQIIIFNNDNNIKNNFRKLLFELRPYDMQGKKKIRIGGCADGGYVMIEPDYSDIIYSIGVSNYSPFDWQMANLGHKVYEVDGTINKGPYEHHNIIFLKKNLCANLQHNENEITINELLTSYNHKKCNLILQIDIEGCEWDVFQQIKEDDLLSFKQIICEFHGLTLNCDITRYRNIFQKILKNFIPVHFHYNNNSKLMVCDDFLLSFTYEISFVRRDLGSFIPSTISYPTILDFPNNPSYPEIFIGKFELFD